MPKIGTFSPNYLQMEKKEKLGFLNLAKKSFAVLTASLGTLLGNQSKALPPAMADFGDRDLNTEHLKKRVLRPQLVLKLNVFNPENSLVSMHTSHSSHSSHYSSSGSSGHYSHSSHTSHSSHYSSSPSYTPSSSSPSYTPVKPSHSSGYPTYTPSSSSPSYTPPKPSSSSSTPVLKPSTTPTIKPRVPVETGTWVTLTYYQLGSRVLFKGCEGTDVKDLQELLFNLNYDIPLSGFFEAKTDAAVKKFQKLHGLKADGRVGSTTLSLIQSQ